MNTAAGRTGTAAPPEAPDAPDAADAPDSRDSRDTADVPPETAAPTDPALLPGIFAAAFSSGDPDAVERLFEPDALFVTAPGSTVAGADRRRAHAEFLRLGLPIRLTLRHCYVSGDLALLIGDHLIEGVGPDGPVRMAGTATDVARRGPDGRWRYVIDNPSGTDH